MKSSLRATVIDRQTNRQIDRSPELGFTIIEVALVLAVAGLVFLLVSLALPALQKSQRDTARKQTVSRVVAAIEQYYADGGTVASIDRASNAASTPLSSYIANANIRDLFANGVMLHDSSAVAASIAIKNTAYAWGVYIDVYAGFQCDESSGNGVIKAATSSKQVAVAAQLESGNAHYSGEGSGDV